MLLVALMTASTLSVNVSQAEKDLENWRQLGPFINYPVEVNIERILEERNLSEKCINLGSNYGSFNYILNGISYNKLRLLENGQLSELQTLDWGKGIKKNIDFKNYNCLVLADYPEKKEMRQRLETSGFKLIYRVRGEHIPTVIEVWIFSK